MKNTYKFILLTLLAITSYSASAEMEFAGTNNTNSEVVTEPRLQLKLFPGIARAPKNSLAMHMVDSSSNEDSVLNLNSSIVKPAQAYQKEKYFDDIEITTNNIFELRF